MTESHNDKLRRHLEQLSKASTVASASFQECSRSIAELGKAMALHYGRHVDKARCMVDRLRTP